MLWPHRALVKNRVFSVERVARTTSTQDVVRRAARAGAPDGFCCLAGEQTAGRGRQGRRWQAPPGSSMLASVLVRLTAGAAPGVPFAAGLAMVDALASLCPGVDARLKWPNDVLAGGRKLAGLLAEVEPASGEPDELAVAVGAGLNLRVDHFPPGVDAVSLHRLTNNVPDADTLLDAWLPALDGRLIQLESEGLPGVLLDWKTRAAGLGRPVRAQAGSGVVEGIAADIADDGALLIVTGEATIRLLAGDVHLLDP